LGVDGRRVGERSHRASIKKVAHERVCMRMRGKKRLMRYEEVRREVLSSATRRL
jgi:hypothetical protein